MTGRLLAALGVCLAFPATAKATTISVDGGPIGSAIAVTITVTGGPGNDVVTVNQGNGDFLTVTTVAHDGLPRLSRVVARYRAPAPPRLRRVRAIRRRHGVLRWKGQPGADAYAVALAPSGATTITATTRAPA